MRKMTKTSTMLRMIAVVVLGLATMACARGNKGPEARLGNSLNDQGSGDRGRPGGRGNHPPGSAGEFQANGSDTVYFSSDSSDLTPEAQQSLQVQAKWLQRYANHTVSIEGHADERGTREYNIALGARRAESVRRFLIGAGVNAARVRSTSYGKERPVAVCNDISCWSQNRRAQTVLGGNAVSRN